MPCSWNAVSTENAASASRPQVSPSFFSSAAARILTVLDEGEHGRAHLGHVRSVFLDEGVGDPMGEAQIAASSVETQQMIAEQVLLLRPKLAIDAGRIPPFTHDPKSPLRPSQSLRLRVGALGPSLGKSLELVAPFQMPRGRCHYRWGRIVQCTIEVNCHNP